ncbi:MAG: hypothetical protein JSS66_14585 [Armatimonadetes bacterium]|nr:hypothetical protein [Armatimonadota bacterium]
MHLTPEQQSAVDRLTPDEKDSLEFLMENYPAMPFAQMLQEAIDPDMSFPRAPRIESAAGNTETRHEIPFGQYGPEERHLQLTVLGLGVALSPSKWRDRSDELWYAADVLESHYVERVTVITDALNAGESPVPMEKGAGHLAHIAGMLRAMSLECLVKAAWYSMEIRAKGHIAKADDPVRINHDMVALLDKLGVPISTEDREDLSLAPVEMQMGRYPFAWVGKGQSQEMTIQARTSSTNQTRLRITLMSKLHELTKDQALAPNHP